MRRRRRRWPISSPSHQPCGPTSSGAASSPPGVRARAGRDGGRLFRRHHHDHLAAFHARELLDLGDRIEVILDPHQDIHAEILVRQLAAAEAHGDFHLVALADEADHAAHLDVVVVLVDAGAQLDLLDLDDLLLLARLVLLLLLLVFVFAVIEDLADRRLGARRDLDEVETGLIGHGERFVPGDYPDHTPLLIDEAYAGDSDFFIDARTFAGRREIHWWPGYLPSPVKH